MGKLPENPDQSLEFGLNDFGFDLSAEPASPTQPNLSIVVDNKFLRPPIDKTRHSITPTKISDEITYIGSPAAERRAELVRQQAVEAELARQQAEVEALGKRARGYLKSLLEEPDTQPAPNAAQN